MSTLGSIQSDSEMGALPFISVISATAGTTVTISVANTLAIQVFKWTAGQAETVNISGSHPVGKIIIFQITNDAILARIITMGTGIIPTLATITGIASKVSTIMFVSNGTSFYEVSRSTAL